MLTIRTEAGTVLCERCAVADTPRRRLVGVLGRRSLAAGEGLLIRPASSVHTCFMRFAIDVVFVAGDGAILRVAPARGPWRLASARGARCVVELAAGECARRGVGVGDRLVFAEHASRDARASVRTNH